MSVRRGETLSLLVTSQGIALPNLTCVGYFPLKKTFTVHSSFLDTHRKYKKICFFFRQVGKNHLLHLLSQFVLKAIGRIVFSRKTVRAPAMISFLFFNLFYVLFLRAWYISQTTEPTLSIVVYQFSKVLGHFCLEQNNTMIPGKSS